MVPGDTLFTNNTCLRVYKYAGTGLAKTAKSFSLSPVSVRSLARMDKIKSAGIFGPTSSKIIVFDCQLVITSSNSFCFLFSKTWSAPLVSSY